MGKVKPTKFLISLVLEEAKKLKKHSTKEEIAKLNFAYLNSNRTTHCVYGQMTGNCNSDRANELIMKCTERVYITKGLDNQILTMAKIGGKPYDVNDNKLRHCLYVSPIEKFIAIADESEVEILIKYLRNEIKVLRLES